MKRLICLVAVLLAGFLTISCGDEDDGGTSGGSGQVAANAPQAATTEAAPQGSPSAAGSNNFCLIFKQTTQTCPDCGIWFDSAQLVVQSPNTNKPFTKTQRGNLLIKQSSGKVGRFQADLSPIPRGGITRATLNMKLNTHEGIANADNTSVITVFDCSSGSQGAVVRTITAAQDIKGRGYSKANPVVPIDFTAYAKQVNGN